LKIIDSDGNQLGANQEGEIVVKGPIVTKGYLHGRETTKLNHGWLRTGDIGYVDDEGFLYVLDRRSDLIISGGENVYPAEVESVLLSHEKIADAGVIGMVDEQWGQIPVAIVVVKEDIRVTEEELISYCQQRLGRYKVPKKIIFQKQLPRNAANKLVRRVLKEMVEQGGIK
jgi:O-succinylbenzoic acid--CoA ligase